MVQGGGYDESHAKKPVRAPIPNEATNGLKNVLGTVAMARTGEPHSATSQFFVNVRNNDSLNRSRSQDGVGYAVFGRVTERMDVVRKIERARTGSRGGHRDVPVDPVAILATEILAD